MPGRSPRIAGATLGTYRMADNALRGGDDAEYSEPSRYRGAYSRMHGMRKGQPFFGSGAMLDEILGAGAAKLAKSSGSHMGKALVGLDPTAGGMAQALNRSANTHYLIGNANQAFNARLFRTG